MARDFDFSRRRAHAAPSRSSGRSRRPKTSPLTILVFVGLGVLAVIALAQGLSVSKTTNPSEKSTTPTNNLDTTPTPQSSSTTTAASSQPIVIKLYDGGAGSQAVELIAKRLTDAHYTVENLDKSLIEYDQTTIWYRQELADTAKEIVTHLSDRQVVLKESAISGAFDILIYLGHK